MRQIRLYINVDHVATLRQARRTDEPDPVAAARLCETAGADGITAHLREDRRHIQDDDLIRLGRKTEWREVAEGVFLGSGQRMLATDQGEWPPAVFGTRHASNERA